MGVPAAPFGVPEYGFIPPIFRASGVMEDEPGVLPFAPNLAFLARGVAGKPSKLSKIQETRQSSRSMLCLFTRAYIPSRAALPPSFLTRLTAAALPVPFVCPDSRLTVPGAAAVEAISFLSSRTLSRLKGRTGAAAFEELTDPPALLLLLLSLSRKASHLKKRSAGLSAYSRRMDRAAGQGKKRDGACQIRRRRCSRLATSRSVLLMPTFCDHIFRQSTPEMLAKLGALLRSTAARRIDHLVNLLSWCALRIEYLTSQTRKLARRVNTQQNR